MTARPRSSPLLALVRPLEAFLKTESSSGVLLLGCAVVALLWANLHAASYRGTFAHELFGVSLGLIINDGLMTIFFFVVGMEIKRELVSGELASFGKAILPAIAALGGMLVPGAIFAAFNWGGPGSHGWGIPMATDIAFSVGLLAVLRDRVPRSLVVFLTALAIFDDIGGILVIAFFYGHGVHAGWLLAALVLALGLGVLNRARVETGFVYAPLGVALWYALHHGGIHATIAGVVLGLFIPTMPQRRARSAVDRFIGRLHPFVAYFVMPLFALSNSGVSLSGFTPAGLLAPVAFGTAAGLFVGKQVGIFAFTLAAVGLGISPMPSGSTKPKLFGVCVIAGVGFTVALFIATLAFPGAPELLDHAKVGILLGSFLSGVAGFCFLKLTGKVTPAPDALLHGARIH